MRASSTMREGESRRMGHDVRHPEAPPRGDTNEMSNWDNFTVAPGGTHVLLDEQGPGVINHIWMTFLGPEKQNWAKNGSANHQGVVAAAFFGTGTSGPELKRQSGIFSQAVSASVMKSSACRSLSSRTAFWHIIAFGRCRFGNPPGLKSSIKAKSRSACFITISIGSRRTAFRRIPLYFYAQYRQEYPVQHGKDYVILDTKGKWTLASARGAGRPHAKPAVVWRRRRENLWALINGEKSPSIWGTGTEDYFLMAWGFARAQHAVFRMPVDGPMGIIGGHTAGLSLAHQ